MAQTPCPSRNRVPAFSLVEPLTVEQVQNDIVRQMLTRRVHTSMGWAALQVLCIQSTRTIGGVRGCPQHSVHLTHRHEDQRNGLSWRKIKNMSIGLADTANRQQRGPSHCPRCQRRFGSLSGLDDQTQRSFQISCFVHKLTTQFMWGMTVWRAFPLERSTFFTVLSFHASILDGERHHHVLVSPHEAQG